MDLNAEELYAENMNSLNLPYDDEVELSFLERLNIAANFWNLNEQQTMFWNRACIHPRNCDESLESMQEMITRFQKNPGNLSREFRGHSALSEALSAGHAKCVDFIIKSHTDRSKLMSLDKIIIHSEDAPAGKFRGIWEVLVNNNVMLDWSRYFDSDEVSKTVTTAFSSIAEEDMLHVLKCMIDAGLPLDPPTSMQCRTPLLEAIVFANASCYRHLLLSGATNRVSLYPDNDPDSETDRVRVEFPIPVVLANTAASSFTNKPERLIPMMKIFKEFGGNLWAKAEKDFKSTPGLAEIGVVYVCKTGQNALEFLKSEAELLDKFPPGTIEELQQMMDTPPPSLLELARLQIWKNYGRDYLNTIPRLWIPRELNKYLEF